MRIRIRNPDFSCFQVLFFCVSRLICGCSCLCNWEEHFELTYVGSSHFRYGVTTLRKAIRSGVLSVKLLIPLQVSEGASQEDQGKREGCLPHPRRNCSVHQVETSCKYFCHFSARTVSPDLMRNFSWIDLTWSRYFMLFILFLNFFEQIRKMNSVVFVRLLGTCQSRKHQLFRIFYYVCRYRCWRGWVGLLDLPF